MDNGNARGVDMESKNGIATGMGLMEQGVPCVMDGMEEMATRETGR